MWRMAARLGTEWTAEEQYKLFLAGGILMALVVVGFGAIAILNARSRSMRMSRRQRGLRWRICGRCGSAGI